LDVTKRTDNEYKKVSPKERSELMQILSNETKNFRKHLKPQYNTLKIRALDELTDVLAVSYSLGSGTTTSPIALKKDKGDKEREG
jgi:hypothetical protein